MADNRNTLTDEILVLAETLGDIKARFERVESEFETQSKPLEAALAALSAAMTGIKTLQHHVLDNSLSALSLKVEEQRKAIDEQITVIVGELKGADAHNSEKIALQTAELKQQFSEISANVNQLAAQFEGQLKRVELEAQEKLTKFAAVPGPQGPAGASINPRGNWIDGVTYNRLDVVSLLGTSYISAVDNNTSKPARNGDKWTVLARAGTGGGGAGNFASLAGIAEVPQGGTGITQYAVGDILYASATGALSRLGAGVNGQFLKTTGPGSAPEWETPAGGGDVVGPASATDNALVRFDGTSGTAVQNSNATLTDAGALTLASNLTVSGGTISSGAGNVLTLQQINYGGGLVANASGQVIVAAYNSQPLRLQTQGADALTISSSQNATLAGNLTVSGGSIVNGTSTSVLYFGTPSNNYLYYDGSSLFCRIGGTDRFTIPSGTGNVLIGTTTDLGQKLQVSGTGLIKADIGGNGYVLKVNNIGGNSVLQLMGSTAACHLLTATSGSLYFYTNGTDGSVGPNALILDSSQNATFAGSVKAASQVYAEKSGAGIAGQSTGAITQFTTVNSTTYNVTTASAKVFVVQLASGDAALCYASYKSSTITILGSDGTIVNSSSPSSTQLGIYKSANDHVISFKTGSNALAGGYGSWGFCFLGNPVISIA